MAETTTESQSSSSVNLRDLPVLLAFVGWFYTIAPRSIMRIWGNYLLATAHYFSIPLLLRTLGAPWHRDVEGYGRGFDAGRYIRVLGMNLISRGIGFIIRLAVVIFGLACEVFILLVGFLFLLFWLATPLIVAVVIGVSIWVLLTPSNSPLY